MITQTVESRVGRNGILNLSLPVGAALADRDVVITIGIEQKKIADIAAWHEFLDSIEGKWQGEFERPNQGHFEKRDELLP